MIDLKKLLDFKLVKPLAISAVCFIVVFGMGYGVGKSGGGESQISKRSLTNYTINTSAETKKVEHPTLLPTTIQTTKDDSISAGGDSCNIKGSKSKTYHVQGGAFYERTTAVQCFATEEEAVASGFRKSAR